MVQEKDFKTNIYDYFKVKLDKYLDMNEYGFVEDNIEYRKTYDQEEKILDKYPNLRKIFDDREEVFLSEKEIRKLIEILNIRDQRFKLMQELMFFLGAKEAYYYFKKIDELKEDK